MDWIFEPDFVDPFAFSPPDPWNPTPQLRDDWDGAPRRDSVDFDLWDLTEQTAPVVKGWDAPLRDDRVDDVIVTGNPPPPQPPGDFDPRDLGPGEGGGDGGIGQPGGGGSGQGPTTDGQPPEKDCGIDDKAREALERFLADAQASGLDWMHNERGALIVRNEDGSYELVNLRVGPSVFSSQGAQVQPDHTGINPANIVGFVHNHPSDGWLSAPDHAVANFYQNLIWQYGGNQEFRMYLINNMKEINVWDVDSMHSQNGLNVTEDCS